MKYIIFLITALISGCTMGANINNQLTPRITAVTSSGVLSFSFINESQESIWLHKALTCSKEGLSYTNLFEIYDGNKQVKYLWVEESVVDFFNERNYIKIEAGDRYSFTCDLRSMYNLSIGRIYKVHYRASNPKYLDKQTYIDLKSDAYEFKLKD